MNSDTFIHVTRHNQLVFRLYSYFLCKFKSEIVLKSFLQYKKHIINISIYEKYCDSWKLFF